MPEKIGPWGQWSSYTEGDNNPSPLYGNYGPSSLTFDVYTVPELVEIVARLENADGGLKNADADKATKAELAATQEQITQAFQNAVANSLGTEQAKAIQAEVRASLKADPEFKQQMKDEVKQELLADPDFIAQIVAIMPAHP